MIKREKAKIKGGAVGGRMRWRKIRRKRRSRNEAKRRGKPSYLVRSLLDLIPLCLLILHFPGLPFPTLSAISQLPAC